MGSQRGRAYYGGWTGLQLAGGTQTWGDPYIRCMEVRNTGTTTKVELPDEGSDDFVGGVSYYVFNVNYDTETNQSLTVVDKAGTTIATLAVPGTSGNGECGEFVWAGSWKLVERSNASFAGTSLAPLTFEFDIVGNVANVNLHDYAVAAGYNGEADTVIVANILSGSVIGTSSQSQPSVTTDVASKWGSGCRVKINAYDCYLLGWGGSGGNGADAPLGGAAAAGSAGSAGGDAIHCYIDTHVVNVRSHISGGAGGGGGGGVSSTNQAGSGGGAGRGGNMTVLGDIQAVQPGSPGTRDTSISGYPVSGGFGSYLQPGYNYSLGTMQGGHGGDRGADGQQGMGQAPAPVTGGASAGGAGGNNGLIAAHASGVTVSSAFIADDGTGTINSGDQGFGDPSTTALSATTNREETSMNTSAIPASAKAQTL